MIAETDSRNASSVFFYTAGAGCRWACTIALLPTVLALAACEPEASPLKSGFEMPEQLMARVVDKTRLSAVAKIDGRAVYRMEFNNALTQASVDLEGLAGEDHIVSITFQYLYDTEQVDVAIASRLYNPETDNNTVAFTQEDYTDWPDDDNDGVSNLDEINDGTYGQ